MLVIGLVIWDIFTISLPSSVKWFLEQVVDKYPYANFMRTLKSIRARDLTSIGGALQRVFSFLHVQRLALDIDRYGEVTLRLFLCLCTAPRRNLVCCIHIRLEHNLLCQ